MLQLGTAKVNITPSRSIPLAGFSARMGMGGFEGVSNPLYARICCFRQQEEGGRPTSAILVSADLLWWGSGLVPGLKERIRERWPADAIILHGTHTHSGPQTADNFSILLGEFDPGYAAELESKLLAGIDAAVGSMEAVQAERGEGESGIAMNRRHFGGEEVQIGSNPEGPADRELTVIRYRVPDGRVKAVLVHYACHPVITAENRVSSEFTGVAMEQLEKSIGGGAVCAYLQGTCGDINPYDRGSGDDAQVTLLGTRLADEVRRVLDAPMRSLPDAPLLSVTLRLPLPLQALPERELLESLQSDPGARGEWSRNLLRLPGGIPSALDLEATALTLADGLALCAMNAEVVVVYGLYLKALSGKSVLPLGYSNGMIGYVTTAKQLDEGGYEPIDSTMYFGMPAPFSHAAEPMLREALERIAEEYGTQGERL